MNYKISMSSPDIGDLEREAVEAVMRTSSLSMGPKIGEFESAFRQFIGCRHTIGVNSGTSGLHLTLRATGIEPGDVVITTPFSFVSSTNVILFEHAIPVFVDIEEKTGNLDVDLVRECVQDLINGGKEAQKWLPRKIPFYLDKEGHKKQPLLKAVLAVDVFGQPVDYDPLSEICRSAGITLIEDSCEALGGEYKHKKVGNFGKYGVFAFYPNKQITTGEGGMIVTDDDEAANCMRALRNQGRAPGDTWLQHTYLGYNYRLDELSAAIGVAQMARIQSLLSARKQVADWYNARLAGNSYLSIPYIHPNTTAVSWFVYVVRFSPEISRDKAATILENKGIPVRPYFLPIHLQPYMIERFGYGPGDYPVTEKLGKTGLALPFSGKMTKSQVDMVCDELEDTVRLLT